MQLEQSIADNVCTPSCVPSVVGGKVASSTASRVKKKQLIKNNFLKNQNTNTTFTSMVLSNSCHQ
jgi:hypothetical protein